MKFASKTPYAIIAFSLLMFARAEEARAYLDPGSASYIFQMIIAGVVGAVFMVKFYWKAIIRFISRLFSK